MNPKRRHSWKKNRKEIKSICITGVACFFNSLFLPMTEGYSVAAVVWLLAARSPVRTCARPLRRERFSCGFA